MQTIKVIGVGPGSSSYLTPAASGALCAARVLVGGRRHLESFAGDGQEKYVLANNLDEILKVIRQKRHLGVAVLATGDPGLYGVLRFLLGHFEPGEIEVIPGVSSVQLAFARLSLPWHDALILSAHGRPAENLAELAAREKKLAVLTGSDNPPEIIFSLLAKAAPGKKFCLCFDLSLTEEAVIRLGAGDSFPVEYKGRHNCVMVITDE